ncbi:MAG: tail fiber protein [Kangiellaceae bacterium]|nr:tail fiber protein [Kangiellaceae bacterium]MCW9018199.1 tail fiber protein [Kangiellaceae bacterium]
MAEPFLGEVSLFGFNYPPKNWALCTGETLPITQNQALYALIGTMYGGDGRNNFALPDLRGRVPVHLQTGFPQGTKYGVETVTLDMGEMPRHTHAFKASTDLATSSNLSKDQVDSFAQATGSVYTAAANLTELSDQTCTQAGGGQPHENCQPTLAVNFSIALKGIFPSRN